MPSAMRSSAMNRHYTRCFSNLIPWHGERQHLSQCPSHGYGDTLFLRGRRRQSFRGQRLLQTENSSIRGKLHILGTHIRRQHQ